MTTFKGLTPGEDQLLITWTPPLFAPNHYIQTTSCNLLCDQSTYYLNEAVIDGEETSSITYAVQPGSICMIKLVAVYNPASLDPGIGLSAHTLLRRKWFLLKIWCVNWVFKNQYLLWYIKFYLTEEIQNFNPCLLTKEWPCMKTKSRKVYSHIHIWWLSLNGFNIFWTVSPRETFSLRETPIQRNYK